MSTLIGLTGGIGSGKSTAAAMLADLGAFVIDADRIAHEIYLPGKPGFTSVVDRFGSGVLAADGSVDRARLGEIVFGDNKALADLNAMVHPLVRKEVADKVAGLIQDDPEAVIVVEAALMTETGWTGSAAELWAVLTDPDIAFRRLVENRAMDAEDVRLRMAAQVGNEERRRVATRVIDNNGSLEDLEAAISRAWREVAVS